MNQFIPLCAAALFAAAASSQSAASADYAYYAYGSGIGGAGFHISAANGQTEVIVPCGAGGYATYGLYWVLHRHNATTQQYDQVFTSPVYPVADPIVRMVVGELDATAGPEIALVTKLGTVEIWNQASRSKLTSFSVNLTDMLSIGIGDVDDDGDNDVVVCTQASVKAHAFDGSLLWTVNGTGGSDLAIGQMDADSTLEVAVTDGSVIDCATQQVQWQWQNGFGIDVVAADIDGDGRDEVIAGESWSWVWAFDIDTQLPKWSIPMGDIDCITVANADADPALELLVGEGQWGDVAVYDTVTQALEFSINNDEHGVTSIAVGDTDGDGTIEVIHGAGHSSSGPDFWYVSDAATQQIEWTSPEVAAGFQGPVRGDIDNDGTDELVCVTKSLQNNGSLLLIFDAATNALEYMSGPIGSSSYSSSPRDIALADVTGDGDMEIFMLDRNLTVFDWSGSAVTEIWNIDTGFSGPSYHSIAIADIDADNSLEVVLGGEQFLHMFEYGAATESWHSFYLGGKTTEIHIGNSDVSSELEIHALSVDGNIYVFDGPTQAARAILQDGGTNRTAIELLDGLPAMIAGDELGHMYLFLNGGGGYFSIGPLPIATSAVTGLGYYPSLGLLHVSSNDAVALQFGASPAWFTASHGMGFGKKVDLNFATARVSSAGQYGLSVFQL